MHWLDSRLIEKSYIYPILDEQTGVYLYSNWNLEAIPLQKIPSLCTKFENSEFCCGECPKFANCVENKSVQGMNFTFIENQRAFEGQLSNLV